MRSRTITGQFFLQCTGNSLLRKEKNKKNFFYDLLKYTVYTSRKLTKGSSR